MAAGRPLTDVSGPSGLLPDSDVGSYICGRLADDRLRTGVAWWPLGASYLADPYPALRRLRDTDPCHRCSLTKGFLVSRYRDIDRVLRDHKHFRNSPPRNPQVAPPLVGTNPPVHTRLRRLASRAFTAGQVARMEDHVRTTAHKLLDRVAEKDTFDLMSAFAKPLPVRVIGRMIGWPKQDFAIFENWSAGVRRPEPFALRIGLAPLVEHLTRCSRNELRQWIRTKWRFDRRLDRLVEERRSEPRDDVVSKMVDVGIEDDRLTLKEARAMVRFLLSVGNSSTTNLIGNGMLALLRRPEQLQLLRERPDLLAEAVQELLRYDAPLQIIRRVAAEDIEVAGRLVAAESQVLLLLGGANRDPGQFPRPDELDFGRADKRNVAFGRGVHRCLGARLAEMEGRVAVEVLLERFTDIQLASAPPPSFKRKIIERGLKHLHIRVRRRRRSA